MDSSAAGTEHTDTPAPSYSGPKLTVRLTLVSPSSPTIEEIDIIPSLPVVLTKSGSVVLCSLLWQLRTRGYSLGGGKIWFFSHSYDALVFCGCDPLPRAVVISKDEYDQKAGVVELRAEIIEHTESHQEITDGKPTFPRVKERVLGTIVRKVKTWRELYLGCALGQERRLSLKEAAKAVRLPKKTLDDYLQQLKAGKRGGFDFAQHANQGVGTLRDFLRVRKAAERDTEVIMQDQGGMC